MLEAAHGRHTCVMVCVIKIHPSGSGSGDGGGVAGTAGRWIGSVVLNVMVLVEAVQQVQRRRARKRQDPYRRELHICQAGGIGPQI